MALDLEVTVARNVRRLREGRALSQQQLGSDLFGYGFGMNQVTVADLEARARPLRLNEVTAIAAQAADVEQMAADYCTSTRSSG